MKLASIFLLISVGAIGQSNESLRFIENKGQWNPHIDFQAVVPGGRVGVSSNGFSIVLLDMEEMDNHHLATSHGAINEFDRQPAIDPVVGHYFRINLIGSNEQSKAIVQTPLEGHYNYFQGNDPCRWASNARAYASIVYPDVYDGIDFRVSSAGRNLKYDFIVRQGADPSQIKLEYYGTDGIELSDDDLEIRTAVGPLTELKPFSYQEEGSNKQAVPSQYRLDHNIVSFFFPAGYNECNTLVIDPLLIFSTYSGSTADNWGSTATPGEHGTLYSAGVTRQNLGGFFPATAGAFQTTNHGEFDMAIIKYDSTGTAFLYATHLGGASNDSPESLVVDKASGDLIVLGISSSSDYPTSANAYDKTFNRGASIFNRVLNTTDEWDIVVTRLSSNGGQLIGSTFLGGSGNDGLNLPKQSGGPLVVNYGDEMRGDVITDDTGHVFITSVTGSGDFPIVNGFDISFNGGTTDGVVVKFAPDLSSIVWSTYIGGSGFDAAYSIKFDENKNIVLAGGTTSADFPVTPGSYQTTFKGIVDGWIARVAADGSTIMNATFTGTSSFDQVYFVDLNAGGNVYCYGQTAGHMPVTPATVYRNPNSGQFVQKFSADLTSLQFSTVFGAPSNGLVIPNISPTAFLVNDCGNIYMAGWGGFVNSSIQTGFWQSSTTGMPVSDDAYQKTTSGSDFYFIVLNGDATQLVYATYLGGGSSKTHVDGGTSRFDKYGVVYHAVCSGCSFGNTTNGPTSDFPTTPNAKSRINASQNCNNAAFKFDLSSLKARFETNNIALTMPGFNNVCYPDSIVFQNVSTGGKTVVWEFGDGTVVTQKNTDSRNLAYRYQRPGQYHVKLKITDLSTCSQTDSTIKVINYFKDNIKVGADAKVCEGGNFYLTATGGVSYNWSSSDRTFTSTQQFPLIQPTDSASYFVRVVDANGCSKTDTINISVTRYIRASFQTYDVDFSKPGLNDVCYPDSLRFKNLSTNGQDFIWDFDDGTVINKTKTDTASLLHGFAQAGVYKVKLKAINPNSCNKADSLTRIINYFKEQIHVGEDGEICEGTTFQLTAAGGSTYAWFTEDRTFISSSHSITVQPAHTTKYFISASDVNKCALEDTVHVVVLDSVDLKWKHNFEGNCTGRPSIVVQNLTSPADDVTFLFDFGDGTTSEDMDVEHSYEKDGLYQLKIIAQKRFCQYQETVSLPVYEPLIPNVFTPETSPGYNDSFAVVFGADKISPADIGINVELMIFDRWGKKVFESRDYRNDWKGDGLSAGVYYVQVKVGDFATCKTWLHILK